MTPSTLSFTTRLIGFLSGSLPQIPSEMASLSPKNKPAQWGSAHSRPNPEPPFRAHRRPKFKSFESAKEIPPLPRPQNETDFFANWSYRERAAVMPGLPDVPFLTAWTLADGNCYWAAIAMLVYGDFSYWPIVKGQHYVWFCDIIKNPDHPRKELYDFLNEDGSLDMVDRLECANEWTSTSMMQVTADLYDLFLIMLIPYKDTPMIYARGCRNAPHRFMRLVNGNHYEPMRPAYGCSSEFHLPETTTEENRLQSGENTNSFDVPVHRTDMPGVPLPEQLLPRPQLEVPTEQIIEMMLGLDGSDSDSGTPSFKLQLKRDYSNMTKSRMKEVLKTEYNYKGVTTLKGDTVRKTLEKLDREKAIAAAKLAKDVKSKKATEDLNSGNDKKSSKSGEAEKATEVGKITMREQVGNGKKGLVNNQAVKGTAALSKAKTKPTLRVDIPDPSSESSDGASDLSQVKSSKEQPNKRKSSDDSSATQSKKQKIA